jgi:23S rRNA (uracil1939-C5)-methyltransferase
VQENDRLHNLNIYEPKLIMAKRRRLPQTPVEVQIESLSQDGRGVTHIDGKAIFIDGALPNERVMFQYTVKRRKYAEGKVIEILEASPDRVEPNCEHFGLCGGCSLQHLDAQAQIHYKQTAMLDSLKHIGKVTPERVFEPLTGDTWGYRRKARLGAKFVHKKGRALVGFRERRNGFLADLKACEVLHPDVGHRLTDLQELIGKMSIKEAIPQIEVAIGDNNTSLIVRHLKPLSEQDLDLFKQYAIDFNAQLYLQSGGIDTIKLLHPDQAELYYEHADFDTRIDFGPNDFFQVNSSINRKMVPWVVDLLDLSGKEKVLDLFCGLGNFTLPIARQAQSVTGVEGDKTMVHRAKQAALANGIENTDYYACNLMGDLSQADWFKQRYDRILLDPPRSGAKEGIEDKRFAKLGASKIVYVSCHPATLARDAGTLVHTHGYKLVAAGVMDMFPHTAHVESIAVFEK